MKNLTSFDRSEHGVNRVYSEVRNIFFRKLTAHSASLFLRGGDVISVGPQANSLHEPDLTHFIKHCSGVGYGDFLVDIGANIGLTTCQNGRDFSQVVCFEPNPLCVHILKVNVEIAGISSKTSIFEFGLGEERAKGELWVPRHNWGGAFVRSNENSYTDDVLSAKDGLEVIDDENYSILEIRIEPTEEILSDTFSKFADCGLKKGVVKIDVEGMELAVLKGLARSIPNGISVVVLFENWDHNFDFKAIEEIFSSRNIELMKLDYKSPLFKKWPRFVKAASLLFSKTNLKLTKLDEIEDKKGDIVILV